MFQLETQNIRFNYRDICSKGCWNQGSPKVIQGHLESPSVKNKINCNNSYTIKLQLNVNFFYVCKNFNMQNHH